MRAFRLIAAVAIASAPTFAGAQNRDAALDSLVQNSRNARSDALLVIRDDRVIVKDGTGASTDPIEMMSATKGIVSLAVMKAITDGRIRGLDEPVHTWYPEWKQGRKQSVTLRMLLNHTSGLQNVPNAGVEIEPARDMVQLALAAELDAEPGTRFAYNNKATNLLAGIVQRATGLRLDRFVQSTLFAPLGIVEFRWRHDRAGNPQAMAGLQLNASDAAKLGQLVLNKGRWAGKSLVRSDLIDTLLAPGSSLSPDLGLMWARTPAFIRYTLTPEGLERLQRIGLPADLVARLKPLVGRSIQSRTELRKILRERFGSEGMRRWAETMNRSGNSANTIFATEHGPVAAYHAEGYLGQYLVVIPQARIVAVRQYRARPNPLPEDSYPGFVEDLLALSRSLHQ